MAERNGRPQRRGLHRAMPGGPPFDRENTDPDKPLATLTKPAGKRKRADAKATTSKAASPAKKSKSKAKAKAKAKADDEDEDEDEDADAAEQPATASTKASGTTAKATKPAGPTRKAPPPSTQPVLTADWKGPRALPASLVQFLSQLIKHNDRGWFKGHKDEFESSRSAFLAFFKGVVVHMERLDRDLGLQDPEQCIFRIYRDIRFTRDKTPYKTCFAAAMARQGRKSPHACYYLHIQPGGRSFVGGGMWQPDRPLLQRIRQAIAQGAGPELLDVTERSAAFQKHYGPQALFCDDSERLKVAPKGFAKDHPFLETLKLKSFIAERPLPDDLLTSPALLETVVEAFTALTPFVHLLNSLSGLQ